MSPETKGKLIDFKIFCRKKKELILEYPGMSILGVGFLWNLISSTSTYTITICGAIIYGMIMLRELLNHKKEHDELTSLDIHYFETASKNLEDPLDGYIDTCINEYMLIYQGYKDTEYINSEMEKEIRKEVLELVASNIGPLMKKKFEMYYGHGRVEAILARKCFLRISLYVANVNKTLHQSAGKDEEEAMNRLFRDAMMGRDPNQFT